MRMSLLSTDYGSKFLRNYRRKTGESYLSRRTKLFTMTLHGLQRKLKGFDIRNEVREAIEETAESVADFNRRQMYAGIRSTGTEIKPLYAPLTILIKDQKGQPTDRVTLKDTGEFYAGVFVDVNSETFEIDSTDEKSEALKGKYGDRIFGLTPESKGEYAMYTFFPALRDRIIRKLGFKFE
jgi:hypothetical protein